MQSQSMTCMSTPSNEKLLASRLGVSCNLLSSWHSSCLISIEHNALHWLQKFVNFNYLMLIFLFCIFITSFLCVLICFGLLAAWGQELHNWIVFPLWKYSLSSTLKPPSFNCFECFWIERAAAFMQLAIVYTSTCRFPFCMTRQALYYLSHFHHFTFLSTMSWTFAVRGWSGAKEIPFRKLP